MAKEYYIYTVDAELCLLWEIYQRLKLTRILSDRISICPKWETLLSVYDSPKKLPVALSMSVEHSMFKNHQITRIAHTAYLQITNTSIISLETKSENTPQIIQIK